MTVRRGTLRAAGGVLAALVLVGPLSAQDGGRFVFSTGGMTLRLQSRVSTGVAVLTGTAFGGEGSVALWRVALELGYWQGNLAADRGLSPQREVIEGKALLAVRAARWLILKGGAHARSFVTTAGTERWLFWEARLRAERQIVNPTVRGHLELWRALATEVNSAQAFDRGQGGEAGMTLRLQRSPVWFRLGYRIEDARLGGGTRQETIEALTVSVGAGGAF